MSPTVLQRRFLKNIPTKFQFDEFTAEDFQDHIMRAINDLEIDLNLDIYPVQRAEKVAFSRSEYKNFIHLHTVRGPILEIESLIIRSADEENLYQIPPEWIDPGNFHYRQLNVIPLLAAYGLNTLKGSVTNAGITFLTVLEGLTWVPSYWEIKYTSGVCSKKGQVPVSINELIGIYAAKEILSQAQTAYTKNSVSIGQDGLSQSTSGPGVQVFAKRIEELERKEERIKGSLKKMFGQKFIMGWL